MHKVRLAIALLLLNEETLTFALLKKALQASDGNLGAQLRKLEEVGYVTVKKVFQDRKPVTWYSLSAKGRKAMATHLVGLQYVLAIAQGESLPIHRVIEERPLVEPMETLQRTETAVDVDWLPSIETTLENLLPAPAQSVDEPSLESPEAIPVAKDVESAEEPVSTEVPVLAEVVEETESESSRKKKKGKKDDKKGKNEDEDEPSLFDYWADF
ncbi:MAG: transcriptional regulator [bacterium]|nr:transcriptional regulator [bacterium]